MSTPTSAPSQPRATTGVGTSSRRRSALVGLLLVGLLAAHLVGSPDASRVHAAKPPAAATATTTDPAPSATSSPGDATPLPAETAGAGVLAAPTTVASRPVARVDAASLGSTVSSLDEQVVAGSLAFTILAATGQPSAWTVTVVSTDLVASGTGVRVIPAANVAITAVGAPVASAGAASGVTVAASAIGSLGAPRTVLQYDGLRAVRDISLAVTLGVTVPAGTVEGAYQGVITVTVATGP